MANRLQAILDLIRQKAPTEICDGKIVYTLPVDSALIGGLEFNSEVIQPAGASSRTPIKRAAFIVESVVIKNGPREDGVTPNTAIMFFGGPGVGLGDGFPLEPGEMLAFEAVDLNKMFFITTDAADRLRVAYVA